MNRKSDIIATNRTATIRLDNGELKMVLLEVTDKPGFACRQMTGPDAWVLIRTSDFPTEAAESAPWHSLPPGMSAVPGWAWMTAEERTEAATRRAGGVAA